MLYELLTGVVPYDASKSTIYEAIRAIREATPHRLADIDRRLRGDVETIVLKALEKDRDRRYASAGDLARDIRHHLNREPIEARPPTVWSRAARWTVRHPVCVTATACTLVAATITILAWIAVVFSNSYSWRAVVVDQGREARLLALDGHILKSWLAPHQGDVGFAELVSRPAALGGGRLVVLAFAARAGSRYTPGLVVYDVDGSLERAAWVGRLDDNDIPARFKQRTDYTFTPDTFGASHAVVADVFGEAADENEIIAVHQHANTTHSAVRVYDLRGEVLYQVWLDCHVTALYWMKGPRLVVLAGDNGEAFWEQRGERGAVQAHPHVVFALRLEQGFRSTEYVVQESADWDHAGRRLRPVWYKCVLPAQPSSQGGSGALSVPPLPWNEGEFVAFGVNVSVPTHCPMVEVGVLWILGKDGEPVAGPTPSDGYRRNQLLADSDPCKLPRIDWHLGPLPAIVNREE